MAVPLNSSFSELNLDGAERANILVVDDLPDKLVVLESILSEMGQNLVHASDSPESAVREIEIFFPGL